MVDSLADGGDATKPERLGEVVRNLDSGISGGEEAAKSLIPLFARGVAGHSLLETPLEVLSERCTSWVRDVARLQEWLSYRRLTKRCDQLGLTSFLGECRQKNVRGDELPRVLERTLFMTWKQEVYNEAPVLAEFDG